MNSRDLYIIGKPVAGPKDSLGNDLPWTNHVYLYTLSGDSTDIVEEALLFENYKEARNTRKLLPGSHVYSLADGIEHVRQKLSEMMEYSAKHPC